MRRQRSARFSAAWARCFSVRRAITGAMRGDAKLGRLLNGPLHVIELVDRHDQRQGQRGIGLHLGDEIEATSWADSGDLGVKDVAARHHIGLHAGLRAQHARHVLGLRANNGGGGFIPVFGNPAASCHGFAYVRATQFPRSSRQTSLKIRSTAETPRGTLEASPSSVALLLVGPRYFFFAAFFCGCLLRGCLLGCFLGCHFAYSPFSMVCIEAAIVKLQLMNV
jgi:hypothetical protein